MNSQIDKNMSLVTDDKIFKKFKEINIIPFNIYDINMILYENNNNKLILHNGISDNDNSDKTDFDLKKAFNLHLYFNNEYKIENIYEDNDAIESFSFDSKLIYYFNKTYGDLIKIQIHKDIRKDINKLLDTYKKQNKFNNKLIYLVHTPVKINESETIYNKFLISKPNNIFIIKDEEDNVYIYNNRFKKFKKIKKGKMKSNKWIRESKFYKINITNNIKEYIEFDKNTEYFFIESIF